MVLRRRAVRGRNDWALGSLCLVVAVTSAIIFLQTLHTSPFVRTISLEDKAKYMQNVNILLPGEYTPAVGRITGTSHRNRTKSTSTNVISSRVFTKSTVKVPVAAPLGDPSVRNFTLPKYTLGSESKCDDNTEILVYFQSKWSNFMKRRTLRNTWASTMAYSDLKTSVKFVFILGKPTDVNDQVKINNEQLLHGDIIEGDFIDSFHNLTLKSVTAMAFIKDHCQHVKYVIKADDDIFLNLFAIIERVVPIISTDKCVIACHVIEGGKSPIVRDKNSKWYIPPEIFPNRTHLPQFCSGYMVIMTSNVVYELFNKAKVTPLINVDDVYMFGQLTLDIHKIKFINIKQNLTLLQDTGLDSYRGGKSDFIAVNVQHSSAMEELWSLTLIDSYSSNIQV